MVIYTDGACSGNPGPGGWGMAIYDDDGGLRNTISSKSKDTTNNREEMKAILFALKHFGTLKGEITPTPIVYSDSRYAVETFTNWMYKWEKNGWIKSDKKVPENLDLIKEYFNTVSRGVCIDLRKVKGHRGNSGNELADNLATGRVEALLSLSE